MANVKKIKLPSNTTYNIGDYRIPDLTASDAGKILKVNSTGDAFEITEEAVVVYKGTLNSSGAISFTQTYQNLVDDYTAGKYVLLWAQGSFYGTEAIYYLPVEGISKSSSSVIVNFTPMIISDSGSIVAVTLEAQGSLSDTIGLSVLENYITLVTSVNGETGAVTLDANDIQYDTTYTVKGKIDTIVASGGEPNVIEVIKKNGDVLTVTDKTVDITVPTSAQNATTGISIANHSTKNIYTVGGTASITGVNGSTSVTGVQSTTTSVTGVQATTTTASKVTEEETPITVPNVTSAGTASNWVFENITVPIKNANATSIPNVTAAGSGSFTQGAFSGGSFTQGTDSFTANVPTKVDTSKFSGGSFTRGSFSGGSGTFTTTVNNHVLEFSHTHTAATHANDSFTAASLATGFYTAGTAASFVQGEDEFTPATHGADSHTHTPPTLGTAISITGVKSTTTTASHVKSGGNGTAPTLGTAIQIPSYSITDVDVPIKDESATVVPIKNGSVTTVPIAAASATTVATRSASTTTVVTSANHNITDNGHTHTLAEQVHQGGDNY